MASAAQPQTTIAAAEVATVARVLMREIRRFSRDLSMDRSCFSCLSFCFLLSAPGSPILLMGLERVPFFSMEDFASLLMTRLETQCRINATIMMMPILIGRSISHSLVAGSAHQFVTSATAWLGLAEASTVASANTGDEDKNDHSLSFG